MSINSARAKEENMGNKYRYTESGLNNVVIEGIEVVKDDLGDTVYCIPNVRGLHRAIAHAIITHDVGISGKELRFLRTEMGLTQKELAKILGVARVTVTRWETAEKPIDRHAEFVVRMLAAEKLGINPDMPVEEMARRCGWKTQSGKIRIDGRNPNQYRAVAA